MYSNSFYGCVASAALAASSVNAAEHTSLLSCKFGGSCDHENILCSDFDIWYIVREYGADNKYTIFDTLNSHEHPASFRTVGTLRLWETDEVIDAPRLNHATYRLIVNVDGQAVSQHAFVSEFGPDDLRFFSGQNNGICRSIN
jgi:hypothetical protein